MIKLSCHHYAVLHLMAGLLGAVVWLGSSAACAQGDLVSFAASKMPSDTIAVVSIWPKQLATKESMRLAPMEVVTAAGLEFVGLDPLAIERADLMIGFPGPQGPQFGVLVQLGEDFKIGDLKEGVLRSSEPESDGDFEYYELLNDPLYLHRVDDRKYIVGTPVFVKQMVNSRTDGRLATVIGQVASEQDLMALVDMGTLRPLLSGFLDGQARGMPPQLREGLADVVENAEFLAVRAMLDNNERLQVVVTGADEQSAGEMQGGLENSLGFFHDMAVQEAKQQIRAEGETANAMHAYIDRVSAEIKGMLTPTRAGSRLTLEIKNVQQISVIGTLTGLLLPAVQASRQAAWRMQSSNNLKQLGLAMHNFESAYRTFPAAAGLDDDGKPMISWRVAVLPFLEEAELFQRFRLDEPWDSEHNIALLEEMPDVYKHPDRATKPGYTVYQAAVGDETLFRIDEPTGFRDITDGTSNTIMMVEVEADRAVPWTAPEDYQVDLESPKEGLFVNGTTQILIADGSVHTIAESITNAVLKALFTRAGGEVVDANF